MLPPGARGARRLRYEILLEIEEMSDADVLAALNVEQAGADPAED